MGLILPEHNDQCTAFQVTGEHMVFEKGGVYHIPNYQREYSWGTEQPTSLHKSEREVGEFWGDLYDRCWLQGKRHFIGTVLCSQSTLEGKPCYDIVDGQQRITTLFLLTIALRDFFKENGLEHESLTQSMFDHYGQPRLVLSNREGRDRSTLTNLLLSNHEILANIDSASNKMMAAYRGLRHEILQGFSHQPLKAKEFVQLILKRVSLIFVVLPPSLEGMSIFNTLNDRGLPVDDMEKLRGLITFATPEDRQLCEHANSIWNEIETKLDDKEQELFTKAFGERNGFKSVRRRAHDEIKLSVDRAVKMSTFAQWLGNLRKCVDIFSAILNTPEGQGDARGLVRLEVEGLNPLILGIIERKGFSSSILRDLENVAMRLITVYEKPTSRLTQLNLDSCVLLGTDGDWEGKLLDLWRHKYLVTNQDFINALRTKRLYGPGITRRRLLYLLERIENSEHKLGKFSFTKNCTIEHVIPQTLSDEWVQELSVAQPNLSKAQLASLHRSNLHTLGNLTVLVGTDQPLTSNFPYSRKVEIYRNLEGAKRTFLNGYFDKHNCWGFNKCETRSKQLSELANDIWPKI